MAEKTQQKAEEKVFKIKEGKLNAVLGRLQILALPLNVHQTIATAFDELKKE